MHQFRVIYHDLQNRTEYYDTQAEAYLDIKQITQIATKRNIVPSITISQWDGQQYQECLFAPRPLTPSEKEKRLNLPTAPKQKYAVSCSICQSQIKWIDPAKVALVNKELWLQQKQVVPVHRLLQGYAWVCMNCTQVEILL